MHVFKNIPWKKYLTILGILVAGSVLGVLFDKYFLQKNCANEFKFINKELGCSSDYVIEKQEYTVLEKNVTTYLDSEKTAGRLVRAGVYFRDLESGPTFNINATDGFVPASLLKLPLLVTYLNLADSNPSVLKDQLMFAWQNTPELVQYYKPSHTIEPNMSYSIGQLLFNMAAYSDNASYYVLLQHLKDISPSEDLSLQTFKDLGIVDPSTIDDEVISTKSYGSIFRALYSASYLSKQSSELALGVLSKSDFNFGLVAGVPQGTVVAHKFGERSSLPNNDVELHDCGIIYYPGNPYILCVMTEGRQFPDLAAVIAHVSKMTYTEVDSRKI